jgi:hypothetical protein
MTVMWNRWRSTLFTWCANVIAIGSAGFWPLWSVRTVYGLSVVFFFDAFFRHADLTSPPRDRNPDSG